MRQFLRVTSLAWLLVLSHSAAAEEVSREQIKGIDEQVQDIKSDVLSISSDLSQLEEKLIYPSNTEVSLFVSLAKGDKFRLDAVDISIDGKEATHYLYTYKELEALRKGGVQRIFTGNVRTGEHTVDVTVIGKTTGNNDYRQKATHKFTKEVGPRLVEIQVAGPGVTGNHIEFQDR